MTLTQRLRELIDACFTGIWLQSHEHEDALAEIARLCREQGWRLAQWDVSSGLQITGVEATPVRRPGKIRWPPSGRYLRYPHPKRRPCSSSRTFTGFSTVPRSCKRSCSS